jgi:nucleoside-diphosphate-sugar epimerase
MRTLFFTGYPGFLGAELLPRLLARDPALRARCLVQPKFAGLAREKAAALGGRVEIVEGDITRPIEARRDDVVAVWHLAAVYDLAVARDLAMRVNVDGTRQVLDFAAACPRLERLHYVSTCYVSGRYDGVFRESDLDVGQEFNNFYEETKFLAEVEVQKRMGRGLPAIVYRPSVVVGDSRTGATQKFDGPYFIMQWILRQPRFAILPVIGRPSRFRFNVVPRDFVIAAIEWLSGRADSVGRVFQLADPEPMTNDEIIRAFGAAGGRTIIRIPLTRGLATFALRHVPGVYRLLRIPPATVDYFVHPTSYDPTNTIAALRGSGIEVPRFRDYLPRLVEFMRAHPEIGSAAMA